MAENSYLADSRLFYGLELEQLAALYQISAMETFVEEERIFSEGDFGEHLYIVIEGGVRISITTPGEGEEALAILKPGDSFGEMAVIDRERRARSANAVAQQNCSLLMISQHDLHGLFERDSKLGFIVLQNVLRYLSEQLRQTNQKILFLSSAGMFS
jgi:CRP/FNR family cyclic AMP-dependent transcriptional regulator